MLEKRDNFEYNSSQRDHIRYMWYAIVKKRMKRTLITISFLTFILLSCQTAKKTGEKKEYLRYVGDIEQNNKIDNHNFKVCNSDEKILQYFNLGEGPKYIGEKSTILNTFISKYIPLKENSQKGLIRIRFVVNCKGKAGRFRVLQSDNEYNEIEFDEKIVNQLLGITKEIENWEILNRNDVPVDYYLYLIFKINDGKLTEILP